MNVTADARYKGTEDPMRLCALIMVAFLPAALAIDEAHQRMADAMIARSIEYLRSQQLEDGSWSVNPDGPVMPAITGLVLSGMLESPDIDATDPDVAKAIAFLISAQQDDGGIYDLILPNYNTSVAISALAKAATPEASKAVERALPFLRTLQWGETAGDKGIAAIEARRVGAEHPFYGGVGYGSHSRPDGSNLNVFVQALHDAGVEHDDPAMLRAVAFLERLQMHHEVNDQAYAEGSTQGGFIYSTGPEGDQAGAGESKAGTIQESLDDGTRVSRLRAYGSMTYAGFKTYVYAKLSPEDPRVRYAYEWITHHYSLETNPGLGDEGLYYFFVTFARALDAWGEETIDVVIDGETQTRDWANDLIDRLAQLQNEDGSFKSVHDRWMEGDPVLITAYALIALQAARN